MEAMQGQPVEVRMHTTGSAEGGWKAVMDWHQPRGDAERGRLEKDLIFAMQGDEDPRLLVPKGSSTYWPHYSSCLLYTSPSPRDGLLSRMPSSA